MEAKYPKRVTRREALCFLGSALAWNFAPRTDALSFPKNAIIRTVLEDLSPDALAPGITLFHEHIGSSGELDLITEELQYAAKKFGLNCIVDAGHPDMNRKIENLRTLSTRSGVHVVGSGGFYNQKTYPAQLADMSEDAIADELVQEIQRDRLGALGEIGQLPNEADFTPEERKVFRAVGKASVRTNLSIFTHNAYGTGSNVPREAGLNQLDVFESVGVNPKNVVIGHVCCLDDPKAEIAKQIAKRGAFVGFDRMEDHHPPQPGVPNVVVDTSDDQRVREIMEMIEAGYVSQLLLSGDGTGQQIKYCGQVSQLVKDDWLTEDSGQQIKAQLYDQMGYERTLGTFVPKLRAAGVKESTLHTILHDNPRRLLAFVPKEATSA